MRRDELADFAVVVAVARARSFTKAARRLGLSQSALSQIVSRTEARLDLRLLTRTTRSVAATEAGERLIAALGPMLDDLESVVSSLGDLRDKPSGTIRITTVEHAVWTVLRPALARLLPEQPNLRIEVTIDYALADVVADRFDAGIRLGGRGRQGHGGGSSRFRHSDGDRQLAGLLPAPYPADRSSRLG